ncbi:MAG: FAD:protein FMN transferase [Halioglobus sp.]
MGTKITVEFRLPKSTNSTVDAEALFESVFGEFQRLDLMMNPWNPDSELARVNREASARTVRTTAEIVDVVARALHYSQLSDGAFDISFASVGQHYNYREGQAPSPEVLARDRDKIDYTAIELDRDSREIRFLKAGLQIDLGGIAKGYAVDRAIAMLSNAGVSAAVVSAGGDNRILGDMGDRARTVGIRHPRREGEYAVLMPLADTAISTSGDYERFFIRDGVRYHHILDPGTGESAAKVQSASVLAEQAIDCDALSTTVFVLGVERGLALINALPGIDAIIIDGSGRLHYSEDLLLSVDSK